MNCVRGTRVCVCVKIQSIRGKICPGQGSGGCHFYRILKGKEGKEKKQKCPVSVTV